MKVPITFSCIIPALNQQDPKLLELIQSIRAQEFPQDQIEIIVVSEGDSESAKAIGIQKAKGKICVMLCADNYFCSPTLFKQVLKKFKFYGAVYERHYAYLKEDNSLNRYFSLIGGNDPVCYFLGKNDRKPWVDSLEITRGTPSYGCNGFFVKREWFKYTDLNHYYPMDAHVDMQKSGLTYCQLNQGTVWHRTSDDLWSFMKKRYKYARDLFCERTDRRWKIIDTPSDYLRLLLFAFYSATIIQPLIVSFIGYKRIRDKAWFYHPIVCFVFCLTYGVLTCRNILKGKRPI